MNLHTALIVLRTGLWGIAVLFLGSNYAIKDDDFRWAFIIYSANVRLASLIANWLISISFPRAIGSAISAAEGVNLLFFYHLTPVEHLALPAAEVVRES